MNARSFRISIFPVFYVNGDCEKVAKKKSAIPGGPSISPAKEVFRLGHSGSIFKKKKLKFLPKNFFGDDVCHNVKCDSIRVL